MRFPRDYNHSFISIQRFVWLALTKPRLLGPGLKVALAALWRFFLPQYQNVIMHTRPVVYVDHPVDRAIPFKPDYVSLYMSFIPLWMNAIFWLNRRYGRKADAQLIGFLKGIALLYDDAGIIYSRCHTTTVRPRRLPNLGCAMIQVFDPHLNCIPSLHVTIVFGAWMLARGVVDSMGEAGESRAEAWLAALYRHAQRITDTTMLMKQHSVNCVGASLWYLNTRFPGSFDDVHCTAIINGLFTLEGRDVKVKEAVRIRVREVFALLKDDAASLENSAAGDNGNWRSPILRFIEGFPATPPKFR